MIKLTEIFKIYFIIGCQLIGGGYVIYPLLKKYLVEQRNWMKEEELIDYLSLSQCLPGIIALNISIFSGWKLRKLKGALVAIFSLILPSFLIILFISGIISHVSDLKIIQDVFYGVRLSMIVLISFMIFDIYKKSPKSLFSLIIFLTILFCMIYTPLSPTVLIILTILVSILRERLK